MVALKAIKTSGIAFRSGQNGKTIHSFGNVQFFYQCTQLFNRLVLVKILRDQEVSGDHAVHFRTVRCRQRLEHFGLKDISMKQIIICFCPFDQFETTVRRHHNHGTIWSDKRRFIHSGVSSDIVELYIISSSDLSGIVFIHYILLKTCILDNKSTLSW